MTKKPLTDLQYLRKFCGKVRRYKTDDGVRMMTIITNENMMGRRFTKLVDKMGYCLYTAVVRNNNSGLFMAFYHRDDVSKVDAGFTWRMFPPSRLRKK